VMRSSMVIGRFCATATLLAAVRRAAARKSALRIRLQYQKTPSAGSSRAQNRQGHRAKPGDRCGSPQLPKASTRSFRRTTEDHGGHPLCVRSTRPATPGRSGGEEERGNESRVIQSLSFPRSSSSPGAAAGGGGTGAYGRRHDSVELRGPSLTPCELFVAALRAGVHASTHSSSPCRRSHRIASR
jgi:hypothetical protein